MTIALWIIAVCEVIRIVQNLFQLLFMKMERPLRQNAYSEFVKSLKDTDAQFVQKMLEEFKKEYGRDD